MKSDVAILFPAVCQNSPGSAPPEELQTRIRRRHLSRNAAVIGQLELRGLYRPGELFLYRLATGRRLRFAVGLGAAASAAADIELLTRWCVAAPATPGGTRRCHASSWKTDSLQHSLLDRGDTPLTNDFSPVCDGTCSIGSGSRARLDWNCTIKTAKPVGPAPLPE